MPHVTIIVPAFNEATHIQSCLASVLENAASSDELEILVVDGMSTDGTREIVMGMARSNPALRLLDNPEKTVPYAMNRGIRAAQGDVVIRIDGHAVVPSDFVRNCVEELRAHPECGCVGGHIESVHDTDVAEAISLAMSSPFGVGNAMFRLGTYEGYVDTLAFGAYRKAALEQIGLFDEVLVRNQDDELNFRLIKAGYKIWLSRKIRSRYYVRSSYSKLFRQYFQYGYWKVYVNRKHGTITNARQLAPAAFVLGIAAGAVASLFSRSLLAIYAAILLAYVAAGTWAAFRKKRRLGARILAAFFTIHFAYGLGYLQGLADFLIMNRTPRPANARVSR